MQKLNVKALKLFRLDRLHKAGGGVCAYVRSDIKFYKHKHLSYISVDNFHQLWLQLQLKKLKYFVICATYSPPDCPLNCFETTFKPAYTEALLSSNPIFIPGDLNCNMLNTSIESRTLNSVCDELNLDQITKSPQG